MKHYFSYFAIILMTVMLLFASCSNNGRSEADLLLVPMPNSIVHGKGSLDISQGFQLKTVEEINSGLVDYLLAVDAISWSDSGVKLQLAIRPDAGDDSDVEGYTLIVNKKGVSIDAHSETGLFYGIQTLMQLVNSNDSQLPYLEINDSPRFAHRGMMLDCSRHFLTIDFLKKQIDMMAYLKLNRFHWHLTDGTGWRLQINQYPELTGVAAWRMEPTWKEWWNSGRQYVKEGTPGAYGGYYT